MAERTEAFLAELRAEVPGLRLVDKATSPVSRLIDGALRVVTLGGQSAYMTRYVTTLGRAIYLPSDWAERSDASRYVTLRHEAVHLRQFRRLGWPAMAALYLVPILPMGLALGRARLEWEAYAETLRATAEVFGPEAARDPALRAHIVRQFTSAAYGFMWPFAGHIHKWIDKVIAEL